MNIPLTSDRDVGIAFIGAGNVSLLHAQAVRDCPGARLVGLWTPDREQAAQRSSEFGCRAFDSAESLVRDAAVDAVFVLSPVQTHAAHAALALDAGKPVLVEKPVGNSVAEVQELARHAQRRGLLCMPGHNYIYEEGIGRTRELIRTGGLGRLVSVHVMYNIHHTEEVARRYPGVIRQIGTHHAYILLHLAGRARRVVAMKASLHYRSFAEEDLAMLQLEMDSGALAHLTASFAADDPSADPWTVMIKAIGTEGATRYSYRDWVQTRPGVGHSQTYTAYQGSISNEVRHFVQACLRGGGAPLSTLQDAIEAQRIIEAAERSIEQGRIVDI